MILGGKFVGLKPPPKARGSAGKNCCQHPWDPVRAHSRLGSFVTERLQQGGKGKKKKMFTGKGSLRRLHPTHSKRRGWKGRVKCTKMGESGKAARHVPGCWRQRDMVESKKGHLARKTFPSHHPLVYYTPFFGPSWYQNNTTKTPETPAKIRWRKEQSWEHPGAASGWGKLQQQTSDNLLSGKQLLFCHARAGTAGMMLQQQSPLLRAQHHFCFSGKAELSPDGAKMLLRPHLQGQRAPRGSPRVAKPRAQEPSYRAPRPGDQL